MQKGGEGQPWSHVSVTDSTLQERQSQKSEREMANDPKDL